MELLSLHGRTDVGLDLVFKSEYPSWGYMARMNSTTVVIVLPSPLPSPPPSPLPPDLLGEAQEEVFVVRVVEIPIHRKHQVAEQLKGRERKEGRKEESSNRY